MIFTELSLEGCFLIDPECFHDSRGSFTKIFNDPLFREHGIEFTSLEQFYTRSDKGVLRGVHFQMPPHQHDKLVCCLSGKILDVLLDLRSRSITYGAHLSLELDAESDHILFIPKGVAHGFLSLEDGSGVLYSTSTAHHPESDAGIHWDSFGFKWPVESPILSDRDTQQTPLSEFVSPF